MASLTDRKIPTRWIVLLGLVAARFAFGFQIQSLAALSDGYLKDTGFSNTEFGVLLGIFLAPGIFLALPGGALAQRFGDQLVITTSLVVMIFASSIAALYDGYWAMAISRLLSGTGCVMITVSATKTVVDWFAGKEISTAMAVNLTGYPAGIALALAVLAPFSTAGEWQFAFWIVTALTAFCLLVFLLSFRVNPDIAAVQSISSLPNRRETRLIILIGLVWASVNGAFLIMLGFMPSFLIDHGMTATEAGFLVSIGPMAGMLAVPVGGILADRIRKPALFIYGGNSAWALLVLAIIPLADWYLAVGILLFVAAFISAPAAGPIVASTAEVSRPEVRGPALGIFFTIFYAGSVIAPPLAGWSIDKTGSIETAIYLIPGSLVIGLIAYSFFLYGKSRV
jgi:predicted MFS family arabinose efflux permease